MANIETHAPGSFCWIELGTTDQAAAKNFYTSLFGWTVTDFRWAPGSPTRCSISKDAMPAPPTRWTRRTCRECRRTGRSTWRSTSADEAAAKATAAGGNILGGPFDVGEFGRMAVLQDPTGAVFCVWQAKSHRAPASSTCRARCAGPT